jgi:hypothetical protein
VLTAENAENAEEKTMAKKDKKEKPEEEKPQDSAASESSAVESAVADPTGDSSEPAPAAATVKVRVTQNGNLQHEPGELLELLDGGGARIRLSAPAFAGAEITMPAGQWEKVL